jgi:hypothetical protein
MATDGSITDRDKMAFEERMYMENLLNSRFNFFILFFSAVIVGAITAYEKNPIISVIIFTAGFIILHRTRKTIIRCQIKFNIILDYLLPDWHTNNQVNQIMKGIQDKYSIYFAKHSEIINKIKEKAEETKEDKYFLKKIKKSESERNKIGFSIPTLCLVTLVLLDITILVPIVLNILKELKIWTP